MKMINHRLFECDLTFCKIYYYLPRIWGVLGESHHKNYPDSDMTSHIKPIEEINFRWLFIFIKVRLNHKKNKFETPNDGVITKYK